MELVFKKGVGWVYETQSPVPIVYLRGNGSIRYECRNPPYDSDWASVYYGVIWDNLEDAIEAVSRDARGRARGIEAGWEYRIAVYE